MFKGRFVDVQELKCIGIEQPHRQRAVVKDLLVTFLQLRFIGNGELKTFKDTVDQQNGYCWRTRDWR